MKNVIIALVLFLICIPVIASAQQTGGIPALRQDLQAVQTNLQNQINTIQNQITAVGISAAVHGTVIANGNIQGGSGFTVTHTGTGAYTIVFDVPFSAPPDCVIQSIAAGTGNWCGFPAAEITTTTAGISCLNFFVDVIDADTNTVVSVVGAIGSPQDLSFRFICVE